MLNWLQGSRPLVGDIEVGSASAGVNVKNISKASASDEPNWWSSQEFDILHLCATESMNTGHCRVDSGTPRPSVLLQQVWGQVQPSLNMNEKGEAGHCWSSLIIATLLASFSWSLFLTVAIICEGSLWWNDTNDERGWNTDSQHWCCLMPLSRWCWLASIWKSIEHRVCNTSWFMTFLQWQGPLRAKSLTEVGIYWEQPSFTFMRSKSEWEFCSHERCGPNQSPC